MVHSINRAQILGNAGKKTEYRVTLSGHKICTFSVATSEKFKNRDGELMEVTEWHHIEAWDRLADIANLHIRKGTKVYIEGILKTDTYGKEGQKKQMTKIVASAIIFFENDKQDKSSEQKPSIEKDEFDF